MLRIQDVRKTYPGPNGTVPALEGVTLDVRAGEFVVVRGPSGCGKTTLLLTSGCLLRPTAGTVTIDGQDPYSLPPEARAQLRARKIGFVFQQFHLVPYLTVLENVLAPSLALANGEGDAVERARELLDRLGLEHRTSHVPAELSTGERQRVALGRALLNRPKLLLADEPTGNLDPDNAEIVLHHIAEFAESGGAVLLVTHHDVSDEHPTRIVLMEGGKLA
jgi:ABC-type lipoprotein export system ATPase subunit